MFVLTTRTMHWFIKRGFAQVDPDWLPEARKRKYNWDRSSQVLVKKLWLSSAQFNWRESYGTHRTVHLPQAEGEGMDYAPYPGELGKTNLQPGQQGSLAAWMKHQTMLVNENRLNLADQRARQYLARQMENFFFGTGAEQPAGYVPPPPA